MIDIKIISKKIEEAKGEVSSLQMTIDLMLDEGRLDHNDLNFVEYDENDSMFSVS